MTSAVTPEGDRAITDIARRHGLSREAVLSMAVAVQNGAGTMAQFSIPELGGSGQWMRGGMTMVGDMFDHSLKARVDALCNELAQLVGTTTVFPPAAAQSRSWWPDDLGTPSSTGGQNDARYAVFPGTRRLAIHQHGVTRVFDTAEHRIGGVQQQQGGSSGVVTFTSQLGTFGVASLREIGASAPPEPAPVAAPPSPAPAAPAPAPAPAGDPASVIAAIESLAGLHERGILSDEEFAAKKAELLSRI